MCAASIAARPASRKRLRGCTARKRAVALSIRCNQLQRGSVYTSGFLGHYIDIILMGAFLLLLKWELREFSRSRILLFWNLAFPLLLFLVLINAFGGPTSLGAVQISITDADQSDASAAYIKVLKTVFKTNEGVSADFEDSDNAADIGLSIPHGFEDSLGNGPPSMIGITYDGSKGLAERTAVQIISSVTAEYELRIRKGAGGLRVVANDRSRGAAVYPIRVIWRPALWL